MKKNTGCGNGHNSCPPMPVSDVAKSRSIGCEINDRPLSGYERTVILDELRLSIPTEAEIKLPSYAREIKEIRKNVHLTQCKVVQEIEDANDVTLFVEGYVHKNIQYAESSNGWVRDYSVNVPFRCYEPLNLRRSATTPLGSSKNSSTNELRELASNGMEADRCNFGSQTFENYNEPIHCKLISSRVDQWDITNNFDNWGRFNEITEKMKVRLDITLTQKQQQP
ncbi:hypothetical protein CIL05_05360 [Virgibacillus profundi]|uniref:DUF7852 domain-containing protein n=1 Tax=Virgibacillus profundi TaxID=2024555 RepID=A0A2A2IH99_9BACI|nr:hypothetical protein [Virgibacillus profundi]PAV30530.1 hypothetical protein CIL05_05360 [Virgibacillus profundi]PXY54702.1 hypothetical protein CIT14_05445 [Virgibacillus profundi]